MSDSHAEEGVVIDDFAPTQKLRWYERTNEVHFIETGETVRIRTLQQWWERILYPRDGRPVEHGHWREIKLEIGE